MNNPRTKYQVNYLLDQRKQRKLSQVDLAKLLGCSVRWINYMETHGYYVSDKVVDTLCREWKVSPWDLIGIKGEAEYRAKMNAKSDLSNSTCN